MSKKYEMYVVEGKKLVSKITVLDKNRMAYQCDIAKLAMEVCTIRHGGRSGDLYTITRYATDIGLNTKTVSNWVLVYKTVIAKLGKKTVTPQEWGKAVKVRNTLKQHATAMNHVYRRSGSKSKTDLPSEFVQKLYDTVDDKPVIREVLNSISSVKQAKHVVSKRDLNLVPREHLINLMELLDSASDIINNFLTSTRDSNKTVESSHASM